MNTKSGVWAGLIGLALSAAGVLGLAAPALAVYPKEPAPQAWTADGPVHAIVAAGGRVYVGGAFTGGIVALDGLTGSLLWNASADGDVRALAVSSDGTRVLAGGSFLNVGGAAHRRLVALSAPDGSAVSTWKASASGAVRDLVVDGDNLYVGGLFGGLNGLAQRGLGALSVSTGKRVASFSAFVDKNVYGLAKSGSTLVAAGDFTRVNNLARNSLASLDLVTGAVTSWAPGRVCSNCLNYWDVDVDAQNAYVAVSGPGGQFAAFGLATGQQPWRYLHTDGDVQAVTVASDGLVYIGGHFGQYVGSLANPRTLLAAVRATTGVVDPNFAPRLYTAYPGVWALSASPSTLYAGGHFTGVRTGEVNNHVPYFAAFR